MILKFFNVEKLYTESVKKNTRLFLNVNTNKTMDDSSNFISMPKMELVPYDGRLDAYLSLMCTFNEKIRISTHAKLTNLLRYTLCKARLVIEHCLMISNDGACLMEIGYKSR